MYKIEIIFMVLYTVAGIMSALRDRSSKTSQYKSSMLNTLRKDVFLNDDGWSFSWKQRGSSFRKLLNGWVLVPFSDFWHWAKTGVWLSLIMAMVVLTQSDAAYVIVHYGTWYQILILILALYLYYVAVFTLVYHWVLLGQNFLARWIYYVIRIIFIDTFYAMWWLFFAKYQGVKHTKYYRMSKYQSSVWERLKDGIKSRLKIG